MKEDTDAPAHESTSNELIIYAVLIAGHSFPLPLAFLEDSFIQDHLLTHRQGTVQVVVNLDNDPDFVPPLRPESTPSCKFAHLIGIVFTPSTNASLNTWISFEPQNKSAHRLFMAGQDEAKSSYDRRSSRWDRKVDALVGRVEEALEALVLAELVIEHIDNDWESEGISMASRTDVDDLVDDIPLRRE